MIIKKHRHIRLLGQITGNHANKTPRDYRGETEKLELCRKALDGDFTGLLKILSNKEQMRMFSYLWDQKQKGI